MQVERPKHTQPLSIGHTLYDFDTPADPEQDAPPETPQNTALAGTVFMHKAVKVQGSRLMTFRTLCGLGIGADDEQVSPWETVGEDQDVTCPVCRGLASAKPV